uniref:C2 domain-containing protein n=1 Tax=Mucochytrium quahogii TaxID=96639 RepID=A0A7S2S3S0_9STRA|mmetsp:Transcript_37333/g.60703  ORF Transcript_37333/g.60703 Transcript_37333/m.60703 type:complete len:641 (-) Transcript_37333:3978-5900(-)
MDMSGQYASQPEPVLGCELTLMFAFEGLRSADLLSKSDPFCVIEQFDSIRHKWRKIGATSPLKNLSTGSWPESVDIRFMFEETQKIMVRVYDFDEHKNHDFLGEGIFELGSLMGTPGQKLAVRLGKPGKGYNKDRGRVIIRGEKKGGMSDGYLRLHLRGHKFDSKDWGGFGRSDPYYVCEKKVGANEYISVFRSGYIKSNNSPIWNTYDIPLGKLCSGDVNAKFRLRVYDYDEGTKHDLIGDAYVSVQDLLNAAGKRTMIPCVHPPTKRKYQKSSYKHSGEVEVLSAVVKPPPTGVMLDYIAGGLNMNLIVAVDWTASNGRPNDPRSLHFRSPNALNQYQSAIASVGHILAPYDTDGMIGAYGFGGVYQGQVSHCFPLNGNPHNPEVHGVNGLMQSYEAALHGVQLSGPTYFAPLLDVVNRTVHNPELSQQSQSYTILLILTDGAIMDMEKTVDQIVTGSDKPLSIIIVGVGSADFSKMEYLDGDNKKLRTQRGRVASRDIVQFVPYSECKANGDLLAKKTLAEVPEQLVQFFEKRNIKPNPPLPAAASIVTLGDGGNAFPSPQPGAPPQPIQAAATAVAYPQQPGTGYPVVAAVTAQATPAYPQQQQYPPTAQATAYVPQQQPHAADAGRAMLNRAYQL